MLLYAKVRRRVNAQTESDRDRERDRETERQRERSVLLPFKDEIESTVGWGGRIVFCLDDQEASEENSYEASQACCQAA